MSQRAAIRRRRQWGHGFRHIAKIGRPQYRLSTDKDKARRRLEQAVERQKRAQQRAKA